VWYSLSGAEISPRLLEDEGLQVKLPKQYKPDVDFATALKATLA
jgi:hypothetical protein